MPLLPGADKGTISTNISEMMKSDTFAPNKNPKKRQQMAIAAASGNAKSKNSPHRVHSSHNGGNQERGK